MSHDEQPSPAPVKWYLSDAFWTTFPTVVTLCLLVAYGLQNPFHGGWLITIVWVVAPLIILGAAVVTALRRLKWSRHAKTDRWYFLAALPSIVFIWAALTVTAWAPHSGFRTVATLVLAAVVFALVWTVHSLIEVRRVSREMDKHMREFEDLATRVENDRDSRHQD